MSILRISCDGARTKSRFLKFSALGREATCGAGAGFASSAARVQLTIIFLSPETLIFLPLDLQCRRWVRQRRRESSAIKAPKYTPSTA